jgi:hypothetical protein
MTLSPEFTSTSGTFIGGELYISKVRQSRPQVSKIGIFPQFSGHYVSLGCTLFEHAAVHIPSMNSAGEFALAGALRPQGCSFI